MRIKQTAACDGVINNRPPATLPRAHLSKDSLICQDSKAATMATATYDYVHPNDFLRKNNAVTVATLGKFFIVCIQMSNFSYGVLVSGHEVHLHM